MPRDLTAREAGAGDDLSAFLQTESYLMLMVTGVDQPENFNVVAFSSRPLNS
jgi:hypothetical protein